MRRGVGNERAEQSGVDHQNRAGDAGHAAGHYDEQLAAREACQVRPDEQRRLDHAEKDIGRSREPDRPADLERALQEPGEAVHQRRQDAPMEQERGQYAHHQHDRQGLQRQHKFRPRHLELVGKLAATEIAENEGGAGPACGGDRIDRIVDRREHARGARDLEQDDRGNERHHQRDRGLPPRYAAAVFADDPGKGEQGEDAECRLEICH